MDANVSRVLALPGLLTLRETGSKAKRDEAYEQLLAVAREADAGRVAQVARTQIAATLRDLLDALSKNDAERLAEVVAEARSLLSLEQG